MFSESDHHMRTNLIKNNPEFECLVQEILADHKRTTSIFVHELRNPLSLLKGTLQYIEAKHPETKEYKYWSQLKELIEDMEHMMTDASLLNNLSIINKEKTDLYDLIQNVMNSFMPHASSQNIDLKLIVEPGCEKYYRNFHCDPNKFKQVFSNLMKNAFEATSSGNFIHIELGLLPQENQKPSSIMMKIKDNGFPIPQDEIETIFTPFVTYKQGGTGVGLAIVKKVIDLHYGTIQVSSDQNLTCFTIVLPI